MELAPAAAQFHSLGDPTRLAIVRRLSCGEARVVDLMAELELPQSTVSKRLACLRDCRLVTYRPQGRQSFYRLAEPALADLWPRVNGCSTRPDRRLPSALWTG